MYYLRAESGTLINLALAEAIRMVPSPDGNDGPIHHIVADFPDSRRELISKHDSRDAAMERLEIVWRKIPERRSII